MQEGSNETEAKNTGRWTKEEHQKFMYGRLLATQPSCNTARTGKKSNNTLALEREARSEAMPRSSLTSSKNHISEKEEKEEREESIKNFQRPSSMSSEI